MENFDSKENWGLLTGMVSAKMDADRGVSEVVCGVRGYVLSKLGLSGAVLDVPSEVASMVLPEGYDDNIDLNFAGGSATKYLSDIKEYGGTGFREGIMKILKGVGFEKNEVLRMWKEAWPVFDGSRFGFVNWLGRSAMQGVEYTRQFFERNKPDFSAPIDKIGETGVFSIFLVMYAASKVLMFVHPLFYLMPNLVYGLPVINSIVLSGGIEKRRLNLALNCLTTAVAAKLARGASKDEVMAFVERSLQQFIDEEYFVSTKGASFAFREVAGMVGAEVFPNRPLDHQEGCRPVY